MSVATLRRRLADEGTTFSSVVEEVRRNLAREYLCSGQASVGEVAGHLGFSGVAAFGRAFKRWTGSTPSDYRGLADHTAS
jgi:AraC-like DNA-binding protein